MPSRFPFKVASSHSFIRSFIHSFIHSLCSSLNMHLQFLPLSFLALAGTSFAVKQVNSQEYSKLPKSEGFIKEDPHDFSEKEIPEFTGPYPKDAWVEYSVVKGYFMQDTDMEEKNFDYVGTPSLDRVLLKLATISHR